MSVAENETVAGVAPAPAPECVYPFEFRGSASEYFGIWIVNVLLSIITLGIYSAWAKVRRLRYFYGNTYLDGHNFEYWARPGQILIGRLLVFGGFAIFNILTSVSVYFYGLLIPFLFALPWLINKSIAFHARMTSYRNLRLNFTGAYWRAFWVYVCLPAAAVLTLGILAPVATRARTVYLAKNLRYGGVRFGGDPGLQPYFFLLLETIGLGVGIIMALLLIILMAQGATLSFSVFHFAIFAYLCCPLFYHVGARNIFINALRLGHTHRFESSVLRFNYIGISISNLIVIGVTLGLARPWAAIRSWRYLTGHTAVVSAVSFDEFVGAASEGGNVAAAEFTDFQGVDLGI